jgi:hypothetical protein
LADDPSAVVEVDFNSLDILAFGHFRRTRAGSAASLL